MEVRTSKTTVTLEKRADSPSKITGHAAVFYDGTRNTEYELFPGLVERIAPEAFDRALSEKHDVRGLFNHDSNQLLGRSSAGTLRLTKDSTGLHYEIDAPDTTVGRDVTHSIERGDLQGSSFAFRVMKQEFRTEGDTDIREITDLDLFDVGPVTFPAYESTDTGVRSWRGDDGGAVAQWEAWKRSKDQAKQKTASRDQQARQKILDSKGIV